MAHEVCRLVLPEHADRLSTVGDKSELQNHNDAAKCYDMVLDAEICSRGVFYSDSEAGGLHGAECQVVRAK